MTNRAGNHPFAAAQGVLQQPGGLAQRAADLYGRAVAAGGDGVFVSLLPEPLVLAAVEKTEAGLRRGDTLPLAGTFFTAKDNIDVAGLPTSSNVTGFGRIPDESAPAVLAAEAAGAVLIGKTTMDQFATGLNGTRTTGPICRTRSIRTTSPAGPPPGLP